MATEFRGSWHMRLDRECIGLRVARKGDSRLLWQWRNDPRVRRSSFSTRSVRWDEHVKWFESRLSDSQCVIYIAMTKGRVPIGQVRYDLRGNHAIASVSLDQQFRGKGFGSSVLRLASKKLFKARNVRLIHAYVKRGNKASVAAFAKAGYERKGTTTFHGYAATHLVLERDYSFGRQNHD